jgi:hypothetical protein
MGTDREHARIHLGVFAAQLIPAAAVARTFLADNVLLSLLYFNTNSSGVDEHLREALSGSSDAAVDEVLCQIKEPWTRLSGLIVACARGATDVRVELLAGELRRSYTHLTAMNLVKKAIEACWCKDVCQMVVKTVAEIQTWSEYDEQFFWDFIRAIAKKVGPDDLSDIEASTLVARTAFAQRMLELWREHASGDRIGLARLGPERAESSGDQVG